MTVERDGAAEAYDCKWGARGINADVLHQLDDARTHAADEDERLAVALVVFDARRSCEVRLARQTAPHDGTAIVALETLDELASRSDERRPTARSPARRPYRVRFDEAGPDGLLRTSVLLRYAQDLAWFHSAARGFDRAWYARARPDLARPGGGGRGPRADRRGSELIGTTRVVGWRRVWARRRTEFRDAAGTLVAWAHIDWVLLDARGAPTRIPAEFEPASGRPPATFPLARVDARRPARRRPAGRRSRVRPQELDPMDHVNNAVYADWLEEAVIAAGGAADRPGDPAPRRLEYAPAPPIRRRSSPVAVWPDRRADGRTDWPTRAAPSYSARASRRRPQRSR